MSRPLAPKGREHRSLRDSCGILREAPVGLWSRLFADRGRPVRGQTPKLSRRLMGAGTCAPDRHLVDGPDTRRGQFQQVTVGIPEIQAASAPCPTRFAFDSDSGYLQLPFPRVIVRRGNGEGDMMGAFAVMRGNHAAGHGCRLQGAATLEENQDAACAGIKGPESRRIACDWPKPQDIAVKCDRPG